MHDETDDYDGITTVFDGFGAKQTEKNTTKYFADADANSR